MSIWFITGIYFVFLLISVFLSGQILESDELIFHYPNALRFFESGISSFFDDQYSAANTPLPYLLVGGLGRVMDMSVGMARAVTCLFSVGCLIIFYKTLVLLRLPGWYLFLLGFYPYFFVNSFVFYVINYGLFFLLWGMYRVISFKHETMNGSLITGMVFMLAVMCQQFYLLVPVAIAALATIRVDSDGKVFWKNPKLMLQTSLLLLPMALPFALFWVWGGMTHPNFKAHKIGFQITTVVSILSVTGLYLVFYSIDVLKRQKSIISGILLFAAVLLVWFFRPGFSDEQAPGMFTGLTIHAIYSLARFHNTLPILSLVILTFFGLCIFYDNVKIARDKQKGTVLMVIVVLGLGYCFNELIGERHLLGMMALLLLLGSSAMRRKSVLYQSVLIAILGLGYFVFWNFVKFS